MDRLLSAATLLQIPAAMGVLAANTWAVIVCSSRFWFNYRHVTNALSVYRLVKALGMPDSQIILMLAEDIPCNARNAQAGTVFRSLKHEQNLCENGPLEVDYAHTEVTVENLLRLLKGTHAPDWPETKRLLTDERSRILLYMSGHGGDGFLKFHNHEEVSSHDLAKTIQDMHQAGRYGAMLAGVDTCQAGTLFEQVSAPNFTSIASSARAENSYAHQNDLELGLALIDRFTDATCRSIQTFLQPALHGRGPSCHAYPASLQRLLRSYDKDQLRSTPVVHHTLEGQSLKDVQLAHFFGQGEHLRLSDELSESPFFLEDDYPVFMVDYNITMRLPLLKEQCVQNVNELQWSQLPTLEHHKASEARVGSQAFSLILLVSSLYMLLTTKAKRQP